MPCAGSCTNTAVRSPADRPTPTTVYLMISRPRPRWWPRGPAALDVVIAWCDHDIEAARDLARQRRAVLVAAPVLASYW